MARLLKIPKVAQTLGVSEKTVRRYVKAGVLPSVFVGNAYRVAEEDVEEYLHRAKVEVGGNTPKAQALQPLELEEQRGADEERREPTGVEKEELEQALERLKPWNEELRQELEQYREPDSPPPSQDRIREIVAFEEAYTSDLMEREVLDFTRTVARPSGVRIMTSEEIQLLSEQLLGEFELMQSFVRQVQLMAGHLESKIKLKTTQASPIPDTVPDHITDGVEQNQ